MSSSNRWRQLKTWTTMVKEATATFSWTTVCDKVTTVWKPPSYRSSVSERKLFWQLQEGCKNPIYVSCCYRGMGCLPQLYECVQNVNNSCSICSSPVEDCKHLQNQSVLSTNYPQCGLFKLYWLPLYFQLCRGWFDLVARIGRPIFRHTFLHAKSNRITEGRW